METLPDVEKVWCAAGPTAHSACFGDVTYQENESSLKYCILHFPEMKSSWTFLQAIRQKLDAEDFNFYGVSFPIPYDHMFRERQFPKTADFSYCDFKTGVSFRKCTFEKGVKFTGATFHRSTDFTFSIFTEIAEFEKAVFEQDVDFSGADFECEANFSEAIFEDVASFAAGFSKDASFSNVHFHEMAEFTDAEFVGGADFVGATFHKEGDFSNVVFDGEVSFNLSEIRDSIFFGRPDGGREAFGDRSTLSLENARIDKPELFSFYCTRLKPGWFVNVDASKFNFTNVSWAEKGIKQNLSWYGPSHQLLAIAYRRLAINAEENHRYGEASEFRYLAMDVRRFERKSRIPWRKFAIWELTWWYWLASGYGEKIGRALIGLVSLWALFGVLYCFVGFSRWSPEASSPEAATTIVRDSVGSPLSFGDGLMYSAQVMTLQKPKPEPASRTAKTLVLLETFSVPIQAALLALAIRRKFIR